MLDEFHNANKVVGNKDNTEEETNTNADNKKNADF